MRPLRQDLTAFDKLKFEMPPVGIKFLFFKPDGIEPLGADKNLSFCEMLREAQQGRIPFYFSKDNNETCVGKILLGMEEMEPFAESGQIGARLEIFQEPRANYILYQHVPKFEKGIVNYVAFSPMDQLAFEPDVLIMTTSPSQAEIVMRAMTYSTGELYISRTTPVMGCAWIYIYPFQSGKVNYIIPDMVHGMKGRELWPEGSILLSLPYHWISTIAQNLQEMKMHLSSHENKRQYLSEFGTIIGDLLQESQKP
jgi:uncharacterized protein (DUF169 family)